MYQSLQCSMRINLSVVLCMNGDFWESPVEQEEIIQISPSLYFFFFFLYNFIHLFNFIFCCAESSLLCAGFLYLHSLSRVGVTLHWGEWASHCSGFPSHKVQALGIRAQ